MSANYPASYQGVVVNNRDPLSGGAVTLRVPAVLGDAVSNWAPPSEPTSYIPIVGEGVTVYFEAGQADSPRYLPPAIKSLTAATEDRVRHLTYAPTNEPNNVGDIWFQQDPITFNTVAIWNGLGGTSWALGQLTHETLASVDLGTATVGKLSADYLDAGNLTANVTVSGSLIAGDPTGARLSYDGNGFRQFTAAGATKVFFPTDEAVPNQFEGAVLADTITVTDGLAMRGTANEVSKGGALYLSNGTTAPSSKPSAAVTYEQYDGAITQYLQNNRGFHHDVDGTSPYVSGDFYGFGTVAAPGLLYYNFPSITMNGSGTSTRRIDSTTMVRTTGGGVRMVTYTGRGVDGGTDRTYGLELLDLSALNTSGTVAPTIKAWLVHGVPTYTMYYRVGRAYSSPATTTLDTNFALVEYNAYPTPDQVKFRRFACTDTAITQQGTDLVVSSPLVTDEECIGVTYGSSTKMVFPGTDQMIWLLHGSVNTYAYSSTGTRLPDFDFPTAPGMKAVGSLGSLAAGAMTFGGFRMAPAYRAADNQPLYITKYTNNHWVSPTSASWWLSCTWFDPDVTGGTHETAQSARASITMKKRASLAITVPVHPARPFPTTTDDVTAARVYLGRGSADPTRPYMEYAGQVDAPSRSITVGTFTFPTALAAVPPPTASNFPASAPAALFPAANTNWQLLGDGSVALGGLTVDAAKYTSANLQELILGDVTSTAQRALYQRKKATSGTNTYELRQYLYDGSTNAGQAVVLSENGTEVVRTSLYPDGQGLEVRNTTGDHSYIRPTGFVATSMRALQFTASDNTGLGPVSSTPVVMGTRGGAGTFVAPPSGCVLVGYGALMNGRTTGSYVTVSFEIRTGNVVGTGTVVQGYNFNSNAAVNYAATLANVWSETLVSGLTAGATYNIQNLAASVDTTAGATVYRGRLIVTPQP